MGSVGTLTRMRTTSLLSSEFIIIMPSHLTSHLFALSLGLS